MYDGCLIEYVFTKRITVMFVPTANETILIAARGNSLINQSASQSV